MNSTDQPLRKASCILVINPLNEQLLVTTRRNSSLLGLPGGKLDQGESSIDAAIRETLEETGVLLDKNKVSLLYSDLVVGEHDFWVDCYYIEYSGIIPGGIEDGISAKWSSWNEFLKNTSFVEYNLNVQNSFLALKSNNIELSF